MSTWLNRGASGGLAGASRNLKFVQNQNRHLAVIGGRVLTGAHTYAAATDPELFGA
jgi:hypothetical protein